MQKSSPRGKLEEAALLVEKLGGNLQKAAYRSNIHPSTLERYEINMFSE